MDEILIIDEGPIEEVEKQTEMNSYDDLLVQENKVDILQPAFIGFSICGIMCLISLGISVILTILRRIQ